MLHYSGKVIFVLGCQRSGTTLLSHILSSPPDTLLLDHDVIGDKLASEILGANAMNCCVKGPQLVRDREWVLGFDRVSVVWIFRNPANVAMSMLKLKVGGIPWVQYYEMSEEKLSGSLAQKCVRIWINKNKLSFSYNPVFVNYDDLCMEPEQTIMALCSAIDIPFHSSMLEHYRYNNDGSTVGSYKSWKPIFIRKRIISEEVMGLMPETTELYESLLASVNHSNFIDGLHV